MARRFPVQLSLRPFRERDGPVHFLEATSDIRERVRWREAMLELEKLTSMGKMAAGTAHHLNSPLAALLLRVQLMRERANGDGDLAQLGGRTEVLPAFRAKAAGVRAHGPGGQDRIRTWAPTVESVASFFQPVVLSKRAQMVTDTSQAKGSQVFADRNLLETVLLILLSNALDAIPVGGNIQVSCRPTPGSIEVAVHDDGPGISEANLTHVFEPFFTTKEPGKGTGLGLAIAKNFVAEHGGSIRIESETGHGATAYLDLPLATGTKS